MKEAKILEKTYKDKLTVFRQESYINKETGESKEREIALYKDIPCALSQSKSNIPKREEQSSLSSNEYMIYTAPEVMLFDNDHVLITTAAGLVYDGLSGRTFIYPESHGETKLIVEKTA